MASKEVFRFISTLSTSLNDRFYILDLTESVLDETSMFNELMIISKKSARWIKTTVGINRTNRDNRDFAIFLRCVKYYKKMKFCWVSGRAGWKENSGLSSRNPNTHNCASAFSSSEASLMLTSICLASSKGFLKASSTSLYLIGMDEPFGSSHSGNSCV